MESAIDQMLVRVDEEMPDIAGAVFVGLGGTVTTLAAIHLGLDRYLPESVDQAGVRRESLDALYRNLARMSLAERSRIPMLPEGRADVIVAGAAILSRIMARWDFDQVVASEKDILDGLLMHMMGRLDEQGLPG
jgi:exopolyphosphatase/guanosine-5'-triphosphate,3'-diphosphate pyrophosphatase